MLDNDMISVTAELPGQGPDIEALYDYCFGVERYKKASYALRVGTEPLPFLARIAIDREDRRFDAEGRVIGAIRFWPVDILCFISGKITEALLLGPFAVDPAYQGRKISHILMEEALKAAENAGHNLIILVGDLSYYQRFGFLAVKPKTISLPGGRDSDRLLYRQSSGFVSLPSVGGVERCQRLIAKSGEPCPQKEYRAFDLASAS